MTAALVSEVEAPIVYPTALEEIATLAERYRRLDATTDYDGVRLAIADLRGKRGAVESRRVELKEESLRRGQRIDKVARQLREAIEAIEDPLKEKKRAVDEAAERAKRAEEDAAKAAAEAEAKAKREAEEAAAKALRDAEDARLAAERVRLDAERAEYDALKKKDEQERRIRDRAEKAKRDREDRERREAEEQLADERRKLEDDKRAAEKAESDRLAAVRAEKDAQEQAERDRVAAEAERARLEAMKPDVDKLRALAKAIVDLCGVNPGLATSEAYAVFDDVRANIADCVKPLETFGAKAA